MAHPLIHAKSSAKKFGGKLEDYIHLHDWLDETKAWVGIFGKSFINSDGKTVYTRYVGEQHIKEDCFNYIPTAKDWIDALQVEKKPMWMIRTLDLKVDD